MPTLSGNIATTVVPLGAIQRRVWPKYRQTPVHRITKSKDDRERPVDIEKLLGLVYPRVVVPADPRTVRQLIRHKSIYKKNNGRT